MFVFTVIETQSHIIVFLISG